MRVSVTAVSLVLGSALAAAAISAGQGAAPKPMTPAGSAAQVAHGKTLVTNLSCGNCHASNLAGRKGFAPSLHTTGVLREYNAKTFARVMNTGITPHGDHVKKPMPVYHLKAADGTAIYAYLKTL